MGSYWVGLVMGALGVKKGDMHGGMKDGYRCGGL